MKKSIFKKLKHHIKAHTKKDIFVLCISLVFIGVGAGMLWIASFRLPDLSSFDNRKVSESTKIYDRTGTVLLYDLHDSVKRTVID